MTVTLRAARPADDPRLDEIAREGDASADADYLELVRAEGGRLVVAVDDRAGGEVVGFGGVVVVDGIAMVTDLFIRAAARGRGVGGAVLGELLDTYARRMTFSSKHPAALPAYRRMGMEPQWHLLYFEGRASGDGEALADTAWRHHRRDLVAVMARQGARVTADAVSMPSSGGTWIARLCGDHPVDTLQRAVASCAPGSTVTFCTPELSPLADAARAMGFAVIDHDIFCCTPGVVLPTDLHCLDPGLA